jgi:hypothetical protein
MKVAGFGDDALVARMASRVPAWMAALDFLARILAARMFYVVGGGEGERQLLAFPGGTPGPRLGAAHLVGIGKGGIHGFAVLGQKL